MSLIESPLFSLLRENMNWAARRQSLIAENMANADTPGYNAKDLAPVDFRSVLNATSQGRSFATTQGNHIMPARIKAESQFRILSERGYDGSLNKNTVEVEEQTLRMAKTKDHYSMVVNIYKKFSDLFRLALGRGGAQ